MFEQDFSVDDVELGARRTPTKWVAVAPPLVFRNKQRCGAQASPALFYFLCSSLLTLQSVFCGVPEHAPGAAFSYALCLFCAVRLR